MVHIYTVHIYIYIYGACIYTVLANRSHTQKRKSRCCACACVSCMDVYVPQIAPKNEYLLQGCALRLVCWEKTACCVGKRLPEGVPVGALRLVRREKTVCWENTARCVGKRLPAAGVCATSCVLGKDCLPACSRNVLCVLIDKPLKVKPTLVVHLGQVCTQAGRVQC